MKARFSAVNDLAGSCNTTSARPHEFFDHTGFAALYETLQATLTDLKVYRCGEANITVYVVGRDAQWRLAGLKTISVET